jgi:hypothetical protein
VWTKHETFYFSWTIWSIMADVLLASMQKSGVKTLSIIDTISELATDKTEASRLTLPSPVIRVHGGSSGSSPRTPPHLQPQHHGGKSKPLTSGSGQPGVPPRNPKVSVPFYSPNVSSSSTTSPGKSLFNGAKPRGFFATSSPKHPQNSSPISAAATTTTTAKLNLSAISRQQSNNGTNMQQHQPSFVQNHKSISNNNAAASNRGQTPDWIRDIFLQVRRGNREKLELVTEGLESTLIRNLTDHLGNNLLHCVCSAGHTPLLPLLTSRLGNELTGALSDENRKGLTPVQIAIKVNYLQKYPAI